MSPPPLDCFGLSGLAMTQTEKLQKSTAIFISV